MASSRIVIALDCDCFYAQCEVLRTPALRGKPVGVRQKMLVITSSYEARAFGIKKGDSLAEVRRKCPEITICDGEDLTFYTETSNRWRAFVEAHCQGCAVERLGLDELFVDATAIVDKRLREGAAAPQTSPACHAAGEDGPEPARFAAAAAFCEDLRARTRDALGLETSGGVSSNKLLAKLVGSWHKPYQQTTLAPTADNVRLALPDDLDVRKITGVGFRAAEALASLGVRAVGELRDLRSGDGVLDDAAVARFRGLARGVDDDPVKHTGRARAVGVEQSFWQRRLDTGDARATAAALDELAAKLVRKLRVDQASGGVRAAETVQVSTRKAPADDGAPRRGLTSNLAEGPAAAPPSAAPRRESKSARATFALPRLDESNAAAVAAKLRRAAEPLLAQLHAKPASLVILSLGVAFKAEIAGARGSGDIGAFCRKPAAAAASAAAAPAPPAPPPEERYAAPSGADVDASVLAELPKDLREAVEAQMRLDAAVSRKSPPAKRAAAAPRASPPPKRPKSTMAAFLAKPPRPPAAPRPPDGGLDRILEMGFGRARAEAALAAAGGDAARAIETLLTS